MAGKKGKAAKGQNEKKDEEEMVSNEINIVVIGDEGTGKTSLINCYANDTFSPEYVPSIYNEYRCEVELLEKDDSLSKR